MANGTPANVLQDARDWLRQRDSYKEQLLAELKTAREHVAEIESLLAELTGATSTPRELNGHAVQKTMRQVEHGIDARTATIPELIVDVLTRHGSSGMKGGEIVKLVTAMRQGIKGATVYPALYRMRDDGRLRTEGDTDATYFLPTDTEEQGT